jgi:type I restriction enzyme S subunit
MKRYSSYKDSGVEWIGEIPKGWGVLRSKYLFGNRVDKNHPNEPLLSVTQHQSVVRRDELDYRVWNPESDISSYKLVKPDDFVISLRTFEGGIELSEIQGIVSPVYSVMFRKQELDNYYFKYLLKSHLFIIEINKITTGIRQGKNISFDDFSDVYLPIPPLSEQRKIGSFIINKTTKIDSLIQSKQKKITLLKEKRTSLINHVVTKGLNPNVEMKDSGVEWIGEIPSHWKTIKLGYLFRVVSIKNNVGETNLSVYRDYGVIPTNSRDDNHNVISDDTSNYKLVEVGDFVMNKMKCWMGSLGLSEYRGIVSPSYTVMKLTSHQYPKYLHLLLRSQIYIPEYRRLSYGVREGQWDLRFEDFREILGLIPPLSEQQQIVQYLDNETSLIDKTISIEERKIELLKEYKQSLISDVVTGKICVLEDG